MPFTVQSVLVEPSGYLPVCAVFIAAKGTYSACPLTKPTEGRAIHRNTGPFSRTPPGSVRPDELRGVSDVGDFVAHKLTGIAGRDVCIHLGLPAIAVVDLGIEGAGNSWVAPRAGDWRRSWACREYQTSSTTLPSSQATNYHLGSAGKSLSGAILVNRRNSYTSRQPIPVGIPGR